MAFFRRAWIDFLSLISKPRKSKPSEICRIVVFSIESSKPRFLSQSVSVTCESSNSLCLSADGFRLFGNPLPPEELYAPYGLPTPLQDTSLGLPGIASEITTVP